MDNKGTSNHITVCTGAHFEMTVNSGDKNDFDSRELSRHLERALEEKDSLIRQLEFRQQANQEEALHRQALLQIRAQLDQVGTNVEASTEYDTLVYIDKILETCGFPRYPQLPAKVNEVDDIFAADGEIPF